jgi:VWFA-related protein
VSARRFAASAIVAAIAGLAFSSPAQEGTRRRGFEVRVTAPKNGDVVFGRAKITAEVRLDRPADLDRVEFSVDERVIFVDREAPYEALFDFGEESRSWIVRAAAFLRQDDLSVSDTVVTRKIDISFFEEVNRVLMWATVVDREDRPISERLTEKDFRVFEDGVEVPIAEFSLEDRPIAIAILLDSSGSMRDQTKELHQAAASFVDTLRDEDRALVIDFDDKVFLLEDLTSDREALRTAVTSTEALGGTSIYDALHAAYRKMRDLDGRKAIVLFSDGDDTSSQFPYERILEEAKSENALIYSIGLGGGNLRKGPLKELAEVTGGRAFFVDRASELTEAYARIAEELRRQYFLSYSSPNTVFDGRWIEIEVDAGGNGREVRTREGYFAVRPGESREEAQKRAKDAKKK